MRTSPGATAESNPNAPATLSRRRCLLIADDNTELNDLLSAYFRELQWQELFQAFDGPSALQLARRHQPSVILLDLELPVLYGQVVMRALHRDPATAPLKIIVLTGHPEMLTQQDCQAAFAVVRKPFELNALTDLVEQALASSGDELTST